MIPANSTQTNAETNGEVSQFNTEHTANQTDSRNSNFTNEEIEGTPFRALGDGTKWKAVLGDYQVTEEFPSKAALIEYIKSKSWRLLTTVIAVIMEQIKKMDELKAEVEKQNTN